MKKLLLSFLIVGTFATGCMKDNVPSTSSIKQTTSTIIDKTSTFMTNISETISSVFSNTTNS